MQFISSNRIAADDNPMLPIFIAMKPVSLPPFPLEKIEEMTELMAVLATCTEVQQERFLLYALEDMSFSENLKAIRKEKNISQEDLAEMLSVSRQAVSKWEQGIGFPEMEKILTLSKELNVSLDYLMGNEEFVDKSQRHDTPVSGKITIRAQDGKSVVNCYKVVSYPVSKGDGVPKYALFGIDSAFFWTKIEIC